MEHILYGAAVADSILDKTKKDISLLKQKGIVPAVATIRIGKNEDEISYEKSINKKCSMLGIEHKIVELAQDISEEELLDIIDTLNDDRKINGILLFRPLPKYIDEEKVRNSIAMKKDIDGMSDKSLIGLLNGNMSAFAPCTALACIAVLKHYNIEISGKNIVILGRSLVVGKPLALLLTNLNATVTICHSKTENIRRHTKNADIICSCMGVAKMIDRSYISENQVLIDVGINFDENNKMCGDFNFDDVKDMANAITPVPKGIGAVTNAILLRNVVIAACKNK